MGRYVYRGFRRQGDNGVPARERIIDSAIYLYGELGFSGVSLKTIGARAGVSAPLIIHHFDSKNGLRRACDRYAADRVYQMKAEAVAMGESFTVEHLLLYGEESRPILRYIIQSLMVGGPEINALMDDLVDGAVAYTTEAVRNGLVKPSVDERRRVAVMLLQGLGAVVFHRQMKRLLGVSLLDDSPEKFMLYVAPLMEIYTEGIFNSNPYGFLNDPEAPMPSYEEHDAAA
ncbi:TetR family transcriptional regulator [Nesterenkonia ebinurensis]|uniref:TetR family transcriptional regulator n=1 Tax=Nesterenkonia ebinurensis TaxID=2608252 RepID=UPI00168A71CA|nr:TetR family transcriptional regulator [Nesterenkonia ebinurensis]